MGRSGWAALVLIALAGTQPAFADSFVERSGTSLTVAGKPFRYSGPNIEWLGLEAYGPKTEGGPHFPSRFEVDDALATAQEMGALVVRSQTLGDTVGCADCLEPQLGQFNPDAFAHIDYAIKAAHNRGLRLIITLTGDCAPCGFLGGMGQYLAWHGKRDPIDFFKDAGIIADFERRVGAILNHVNSLTGIAYKDDPTIMAWENCNMCGLVPTFFPNAKPDFPAISAWAGEIGRFIKSVDSRHLYLDTTGIYRLYPATLDRPELDLVTFEFYPHWDKLLKTGTTTAATFGADAATVTAHGKAFIVNEYGWDTTNWPTRGDFQALLDTLAKDKNIAGDGWWALQAHDLDHGWQAMPADTTNTNVARNGESGQWWALYYTGIDTMVNTAEDMRDRAQMLRAHAYAMQGLPVPPHALPPGPSITALKAGTLTWQGSAGAVDYSVMRSQPGQAEKVVCARCVTDSSPSWTDAAPPPDAPYRMIPFNLDGKPGEASAPRKASP